jgi:FkbM family methyltransferase
MITASTKQTPQEFIARAKTRLDAGDSERAINLLVEGIGEYPGNPLLRAHLAMAYLRAGEREQALSAFKQALAKSQNPPEWFTRGMEALEQEAVTLCGVKLAVPAEVVSIKVLRYLIEGGYEGQERALLQNNLEAEDRVLELGAGLGFLACVASCEQQDAEYIAVEANPDLIPLIRRNFEANGCRARLLHGVAADADGMALFNLAEDFWASSTCTVSPHDEVVEVPSIDVNAVIREFSPTMMVVDIEGGELELVPQLDLSGVDRIAIELHPDVYGHTGSTQVVKALFRKGFLLDARQSGRQVFLFKREG